MTVDGRKASRAGCRVKRILQRWVRGAAYPPEVGAGCVCMLLLLVEGAAVPTLEFHGRSRVSAPAHGRRPYPAEPSRAESPSCGDGRFSEWSLNWRQRLAETSRFRADLGLETWHVTRPALLIKYRYMADSVTVCIYFAQSGSAMK